MCDIIHSYGKPAAAGSESQLKSIENTVDDNRSIAVSESKSLEFGNTSGVLAGAQFHGSTTINLQFNQK